MELARYVVLHSVRAGMIPGPEDWSWSSCVAMGKRQVAPNWLEVNGLPAYYERSTHLHGDAMRTAYASGELTRKRSHIP